MCVCFRGRVSSKTKRQKFDVSNELSAVTLPLVHFCCAASDICGQTFLCTEIIKLGSWNTEEQEGIRNIMIETFKIMHGY